MCFTAITIPVIDATHLVSSCMMNANRTASTQVCIPRPHQAIRAHRSQDCTKLNKEIAEIKCQNLARAVLYSCLAGIMPSLNISCSEQPYRRYKRPCKGTRDDLNPTVTTMYINLRSQNTPLPMDMSMTGRVLIRSIVSRLKFARRQRSAILPLPERAGRDKETDVGADRCQVAAWSSFRRVAERDHQHQG
jgi:hypothetical protein